MSAQRDSSLPIGLKVVITAGLLVLSILAGFGLSGMVNAARGYQPFPWLATVENATLPTATSEQAAHPTTTTDPPPLLVQSKLILAPHGQITWSIDSSDWGIGQIPASYYSQMIDKIDLVLSDPSGWRQAGLTFNYVPDPKTAQIVYHPRLPAYMNDRCSTKDGTGCPVGIAVQSTGTACNVDFLDQYLFDHVKTAKYKVWTALILHETGHCLGFGHEGSTVMASGLAADADQTYTSMYPSRDQITDLARRLVTG
jgi:hypothetical protein